MSSFLHLSTKQHNTTQWDAVKELYRK